MPEQNLDYTAIRRNVEKNVSRQKWFYRSIFFVVHVLFYVVSMLAVWGTVATDAQLRAVLFGSGSAAAVVVIMPTILWAVLILCHVASLFTESSAGEKAIRERLLMREVGEEILRRGLVDEGPAEKPKRRAAEQEARNVLLSEDGELSPAGEDEQTKESSHSARANRVDG